MISLEFLYVLATFIASSLAGKPADVREVATLPLGAWAENLAVRADGNLLVSRIDNAEVLSIDHVTGDYEAIVTIDNASSTLGITEVELDVFAVVAGNYSLTAGSTAGSYSIWSIDLRKGNPKASKVANLPAAGFINGLARLDSQSVVAADTANGVVYHVDLLTGAVAAVLSGVEYQAPPPPALPLGVNGLKVHNATLYFSNTGAGTFSRVPIYPNGTAAGEVELIAANLELPDDFALAPHGGAFVTLNQIRSVDLISIDGARAHVAGGANSTEFAAPTAAQLGRAPGERQTLFVTTNGLRDASMNPIGPAKILAVDASSFAA